MFDLCLAHICLRLQFNLHEVRAHKYLRNVHDKRAEIFRSAAIVIDITIGAPVKWSEILLDNHDGHLVLSLCGQMRC